jgi:hypothetical protein
MELTYYTGERDGGAQVHVILLTTYEIKVIMTQDRSMKISSRTQDHVMLFTTYKNKVTMT